MHYLRKRNRCYLYCHENLGNRGGRCSFCTRFYIFLLKADTEEGAAAAVALGRLEYRKGDYNAAEKTLEDAISRNAGPEGLKARAKAYRILADVCRAKGEALKAKGYETVLKELFNDE